MAEGAMLYSTGIKVATIASFLFMTLVLLSVLMEGSMLGDVKQR